MKGFFGKILRIDVGSRTFQVEEIGGRVLSRLLGGKGLGSYLLLREVPAGIDPLGPHNKLIFTWGPLTGTVAPGASRYGVYSKSPQTGLYGESYAGGLVAAAMRRTGYDAVIIQGRADSPVWLEISGGEVVFHPAGAIWGQDTYAASAAMLQQVAVPDAQAVVIGPAGENRVAFACLENNNWRSAGRTGMGAVLGSKLVKGLVFHGQSPFSVFDETLLKDVVRQIRQQALGQPGVNTYRTYGTTVMVGVMNGARAFPAAYWRKGTLEQWQQLSGDTFLQNFAVKPRACPNCFMACAKMVHMESDRYGRVTIEGPEYETIFAFGGLCQIASLEDIIYINDLCDRLGLDTISAGNLVGLVMEAVRCGRLDYPLQYGDATGTVQLLKDMAARRDLGGVLAQGIVVAARELGLEDLAVHVKGLEPPGYDPRVLKGMGLAYATSTRGACHLRATFYKPELSGVIDPATVEGKARLFIDYENRLTIFNTQIFCLFFRDLLGWPELSRLIHAATGVEYTQARLEKMANEIITITRLFNAREGASKAMDTLPERFFAESINNGQNRLTREELSCMVDEYYSLRGWQDDGYPLDQDLMEFLAT
ncbi:aldehyde ferredoxin oxidoreductase family protein [Desulfurispora thermophila]|uniref:aldehyde ferredoxin oxidoreductase family protein n=1 Tax=Desulfurispora thermophila TaxID=265470 RepID=UPI0003680886|nr:aldehyde ferredoxin oxidoreductase family protein [Desulfurispora thermophila]